jgi:PKD repeat protein
MKRWLLFIVLILILSNIAYAIDISANLSKTELGTKSPVYGFINLNLNDYMVLQSPVKIFAGKEYTITLRDLLSKNNLLSEGDLRAPTYKEKTTGRDSQVSIAFINPGSKVDVGFDLRAPNRIPATVDVTSVSFDIAPEIGQAENLLIYLNNKTIYSLQGIPKSFIEQAAPHLGDRNADGQQDITGANVICQEIEVEASGEYEIKAKAARLSSGSNAVLNATIVDSPIFEGPNCKEVSCCSLDPSNTMADVSCNLKLNIPEKTKKYVCVYPTNFQDPSLSYFEISTESSSPITAYVNSIPAESNFYISLSYMDYERKLTSLKRVELGKEFINEYIQSCDDCLLVPLNISVSNVATIRLSNLSLRYSSSSNVFTDRSFRQITFVPEAIKFNSPKKINLETFYNILTPDTKGDYEFYADLDGLISNKIKFKTVDGPKPFITYAPFIPAVNQDVLFDASRTTSAKNISNYKWDFGNGLNATGLKVNQKFTSNGTYFISLIATDSSGISSLDQLEIFVNETSNIDLGDFIKENKDVITAVKASIQSSPKLTETATLLGLNNRLLSLESQIDLISKNYTSLNSSSISDRELEKSRLMILLISLTSQIPTEFKLDTSTFSAKPTALTQIPTCCEFTTETQKQKLLTAQKEITVNGEARFVSITYKDGRKENFAVIIKTITGTGASIYEILPVGLVIKKENILDGSNSTGVNQNVYKFPIAQKIVYKVDEISLAQALQIKTVVLPVDLESVVVADNIPKTEIPTECVDCEQGKPWGLIITLIFILGVIVYFGFFFKGGLIKQQLFKKSPFKTEKDHIAIKGYIENSFNRGLKEDQIKKALLAKKWKSEQVDFALNEIKKARAKVKK